MEAKHLTETAAEPDAGTAAETNDEFVQATNVRENDAATPEPDDEASDQEDSVQDVSTQESVKDAVTSESSNEMAVDESNEMAEENAVTIPVAETASAEPQMIDEEMDTKEANATPDSANVPNVAEPVAETPVAMSEPVNKEGYWFEHLPEWEIPQSLTPENPDDILLKEAVFNPNKKAPDDAPDETRMYRPGPKYISQLLKYREVHARSLVRLGTKSNIAATRNVANAIVRYLKSQHIMLDCTDDPALAIVLDQHGVPHK